MGKNQDNEQIVSTIKGLRAELMGSEALAKKAAASQAVDVSNGPTGNGAPQVNEVDNTELQSKSAAEPLFVQMLPTHRNLTYPGFL